MSKQIEERDQNVEGHVQFHTTQKETCTLRQEDENACETENKMRQNQSSKSESSDIVSSRWSHGTVRGGSRKRNWQRTAAAG